MKWRSLHNTTAILVMAALITAIPLAMNLPRGLRQPWVLAHVAISMALTVSVPVQLFVGFKRLLALRRREGLLWLNGWFGRLLLFLVCLTVASGIALWRSKAPGRHAWPVLAHRLSWQVLAPTLASHVLLSAWLRRRRIRRRARLSGATS